LFLLEDLNQTALTTQMIEPEKPVINASAPELEFTE
jgi:hypothetical protein